MDQGHVETLICTTNLFSNSKRSDEEMSKTDKVLDFSCNKIQKMLGGPEQLGILGNILSFLSIKHNN